MPTGAITARQRRIDHVGGVEPAAETDLEQHHIGRMPREQAKCRRGFDFENGDRRARIGPLAMFERGKEFARHSTRTPPPAQPSRKHSLIRTR